MSSVQNAHMDEKALIRELVDGNRRLAFERLVAQYQDNVVNTCYGFVHNRDDAEDLAQEVFIEMYTSIGGFRGEARLSTWMYRIAVTKSLDFLRRKNRKKRFGALQRVFGAEEEYADRQSFEHTNPHANLESKERAEILSEAIERLPQNQKIAFTLSKFEGLSYEEIANVMDMSLSSIESLLHRAKKNLQKRLFAYYKKRI